MGFDIQRANMWKRISAYILDLILLCIAATGFLFALSAVTGYDGYSETLQASYNHYATEYGIEAFDISKEEYDAYTEAQRSRYDAAYQALTEDTEVLHTYSMVVNLTMMITSLSIFLAYALIEFAVPLIFGNGQTLGKKIFSLGVIRCDGVRITPFMLFVRTLLGKFTVETMIPLLLIVMLLFNMIGITAPIVLILLMLFEIILLIVTKNRTPIHDAFAQTVVVDLSSQLVFDTPEALLAYKSKQAAEHAAKSKY